MDKVFQLMDELTAKVTKEGELEEKAYKEFVNWCDDSATNTKNSIATSTKKKEQLEALLEERITKWQTLNTAWYHVVKQAIDLSGPFELIDRRRRPLTDHVKNLDPPRPGRLRVEKKAVWSRRE